MLKRLLCFSLLWAGTSLADPVSATYTATGTPGAYVLDFTFKSDLVEPTNHSLYWLGVVLWPVWDGVIHNGPAGFTPNGVNIAPNGISLSWFSDLFPLGLPNPGSLGGFQVGVTSLVVPTTVDIWAYGTDGGLSRYAGSFDFNDAFTPGFLGTATLASTAVPEPNPAPAIALLRGLLLVIRSRRR